MNIMRKNGIIIVAILIMIIAISGCGQNPKKTGEASQVKAVRVMRVAEGENTTSLNYIGTIDAEELVKYSFKTAGKISKICVAEGDHVEKGDRLAELDPTDLNFQLAAAQATMDTAEANITKAQNALDYANTLYARTDSLYKSGAAAKDTFDQVQLKKDTAASEYIQSKSQYEAARTDYSYKQDLLSNAVIYAEQEGYVAKKMQNENERVGAYSPVIIIRSGSQIVNIGIPQQDLGQIKVGAAAIVAVDNETTKGAITNLSEIPDESTHTYRGEIKLAEQKFKLGSIAKVSINVGNQNGIWIPMTAIFSADGENCVYVVKNQRAFKRTVEIQSISEDQARVTKLKSGELLVTSGMNNLNDGTLVKARKQD